MHRCTIALACAVLLAGTGFAQSKGELTTKQDRVSYGIGLGIGRNFKQQEVPVNVDALIRGIKDGLSGAAPAIADQDLQVLLESFGREMMEKQAVKSRGVIEKNKKSGDAFRAEFRKRAGVVALADGILYRVLKTGTGPRPTSDKTVECNYRGTLVDGTEFDSSYKRNESMTFPLTNVIRGWQEIIPMMPVGSKWEVVIPAELAYGDRGSGELITPASTLVFEIELLSIK